MGYPIRERGDSFSCFFKYWWGSSYRECIWRVTSFSYAEEKYHWTGSLEMKTNVIKIPIRNEADKVVLLGHFTMDLNLNIT